ncbi:hypothetical protein [Yoonia sediminilitoris]|uniref:Uncharacterized protein n=1 Tax=Yoonia sediminilitoris TaxID=1286148 RepID=A0A2T6KFT4_9RHOB|nr:hypothetical protein [Yoonia sediminilitoris]PUB14168.1 hypothetical protein C8N45_10641 [Yoonia sediminilitoris]RCW95099.1 hypothetical protein DFP92_10641 [Yoonia sediminilitoris]
MAKITTTDRDPGKPEDADFAVIVDFKKGEESPTRVFTAATELIRSFEALDRILAKSVDSSITPVMVLEDVEIGSLKVWLKNALRSTDDQALKDLDWRPAVGKYLVRAKYVVLRWVDQDDAPRSLQELRKEIRDLAAETDVRRLPDYAPPDPSGLVEIAKQLQDAKKMLGPNDRIFFEGDEGRVEVDLTVDINPEELAELATKETIKMPPAEMILAVKKPDYLGNSKWELRHGKRSISVRMEDSEFVDSFQSRKQDVRPGDALRCMVAVEMRYGYDNELISETYAVESVKEVLEDLNDQDDLFD